MILISSELKIYSQNIRSGSKHGIMDPEDNRMFIEIPYIRWKSCELWKSISPLQKLSWSVNELVKWDAGFYEEKR